MNSTSPNIPKCGQEFSILWEPSYFLSSYFTCLNQVKNDFSGMFRFLDMDLRGSVMPFLREIRPQLSNIRCGV